MNENLFGLTANLIDAFFMLIGKTSKILNARGIRICFIFDITCLIYWIYIDIQRSLYSQAISACISIMIAVYGFRNWGKLRMKNKKKQKKQPKMSKLDKMAEKKVKEAKAPLVPNRLPFDQGTSI